MRTTVGKRVIYSGNGMHSYIVLDFKFTKQQQSIVELLPATGIASSSVKFFHQKLHHLLREGERAKQPIWEAPRRNYKVVTKT